ncbi:hypothetical protein KY320_02230, partial [Candidatus Woesearchaeota archaeon]|nr:hypothetical protein [Candidatus Woesearchaeota archaeon]
MKQVAIIVRDPEDLIELKNQLVDFEYNEKCPDFVVSYGGDGTYLVSERLYPGIPKLLIKKEKSICAKCNQGDFYHLVSAILRNKFSIEENIKLKAGYNNHYLEGTNDIVIRNKYPTHALRFKVNVNSKDITKVIIGD